ncbi:hypothetical protein JCM12856_27620 [Spirochaeta dissipatitropha]
MLETGTLLLMCLFAILAVHTRLLRIAVIHLAVFSLLSAFLYLQYAAPELAIAEAAIGSGLVTLLYLAALKRNRVCTIAVLSLGYHYRLTDAYVRYIKRSRAMRKIRHFFLLREFEPHVVFSDQSLEAAVRNPLFDLIFIEEKEGFAAYGSADSYVLEELELMFRMHGTEQEIRFVRHSSEGDL